MTTDLALMQLMAAIAAGHDRAALDLLDADRALGRASLGAGATRTTAGDYFFASIQHYAYAGDTALHLAAAAHRADLARALIALGADAIARNRMGATPLHYAADGVPGSDSWNPAGQSATIAALIASGADPDAVDRKGVTPLHRAIRCRCAAAVSALIDGGADPLRRNGKGSTPMKLATQQTGRGSSGSPEGRAQQVEIVRRLAPFDAAG
ncbi:MAG: ankyrin repeat protein chloroplastic-like [Caulobacter sp.]|nr:ankyrin repeat protein chloroplastic-like [Caulobacter sp.]